MKSAQSGYGLTLDPARRYQANFTAGQYYTLPANSTDYAPGNADFTVEGWFTFTSTVVSVFFWGCSNGAGAVPKLGCYTDASGHVQVDISGGARITSSAVLAVNTLYHIAVARVGTTTTLYINGIANGTDTASRNITPLNNAWNVGWFGEGSINFVGNISQFRYVNGTAIYTTNFTPPTAPLTAVANTKILILTVGNATDTSTVAATVSTVSGPVTISRATKFGSLYDPLDYTTSLLLHGDNVNGSTVFVDSARGRTITRTGTTTTISTTQFKFGGSSMNFTGAIANLLQTPSSSSTSMGTDNFTYDFWMWPDSTSNTALNIPLSNFLGSFAANFWGFYYNRAGNTKTMAIFNFNANNASPIMESAGGLITDQAWNHIALVRNGSTLTLYINGTSAATFAINATSWDGNAATSIYIGAGSTDGANAYIYKGYLEEVRVSKMARWTANFTPPVLDYEGQP
jgi:hypothetical protein